MTKVHVSIVLDRSGSMEMCRTEAISAVNSYLKQLQADETVDARLSVVIFDSESIDSIRDRVPVADCAPISLEEYQPRGASPLLDAVGYSVGLLDCLSHKQERRIMAIMTDGLENASREYTRESLRGLLEGKQKFDGWLIMYLGTGHDSWSQARQIGISAHHTADFSVDAIGSTAEVMHAVGSRFVSAPQPAASRASRFTPDERAKLKLGPAFKRGSQPATPAQRMDTGAKHQLFFKLG
jgi:hypothetical protein